MIKAYTGWMVVMEGGLKRRRRDVSGADEASPLCTPGGAAAKAYNVRAMEPISGTSSTSGRIRPDIITDAFWATLRAHGVVTAFLFGSVSRGEERPESDIDLLVTFAHPTSYFRQFDLSEELSKLTGRQIDLMTQIDPVFAPYIHPTLVPLPL